MKKIEDNGELAVNEAVKQEALIEGTHIDEITVGAKESVNQVITRELSPERAFELLAILKKRFLNKEKPYKIVEGIDWDDVQKKLEANPEKLWSLNEMERTGGEPDLLVFDKKTGEYIFYDCSKESPIGRRECVYDMEAEQLLRHMLRSSVSKQWLSMSLIDGLGEGNAVDMAILMGIELLDENQYKEFQSYGKFDNKTFSYIETPVELRQAGQALSGGRDGTDELFIEGYPAYGYADYKGWRGLIKV